jgi:hypothetical protein
MAHGRASAATQRARRAGKGERRQSAVEYFRRTWGHRYAVPVRRAGPAARDEERVRLALAITSAIESFQILAAARVSAGSA